MKLIKNQFLLLFSFLLALSACQQEPTFDTTVLSPDNKTKATFWLNADGEAMYCVMHNDKIAVDTSLLGFELKDMPALDKDFSITNVMNKTVDETWKQVWGETESVRNHYNEMAVFLTEKKEGGRQLNITFKVYNNGLGFRYEFPEQAKLKDFVITNEKTQFKMSGDHSSWWVPADYDSYEYPFSNTLISGIDATDIIRRDAFRTINNQAATNTPMTMKTADGLHISIHEAALTNYSGMTLLVEKDKRTLSCELTPAADGSKVTLKTPCHTPWRTIQVAEKAVDLIASNLMVNLNEPNRLEDVSWLEPMKYMGIWWGIHIGENSWDQSPKHGATTEEAMRYIDFASKSGIRGLLVEGWNTGWENWFDDVKREHCFDYVTPYSDYDLKKVVAYGKKKNVELVMHHETSGSVNVYEKHMDNAFQLIKDLDIHAIKSGYVGAIIPRGEHHHGQWMVNHYRRVVQKAAENQVMMVVHEPIKPTGIRRTYPNMMSREGLRGGEYNSSWGGGNALDHATVVPFTRMLAGPIDYTPGIFDMDYKRNNPETDIKSFTLASQLALYVVFYSPIQMAADLPRNYDGHPAFQFIKDVPVDWSDTKILNGEIGDFVTIARKDKNSDDWYLGSVTDEKARAINVDLSFLDDNKTYDAIIYADAPDAHHSDNPEAYIIETKKVTNKDKLTLKLAHGGGQAIRFKY